MAQELACGDYREKINNEIMLLRKDARDKEIALTFTSLVENEWDDPQGAARQDVAKNHPELMMELLRKETPYKIPAHWEVKAAWPH